MDNDHSLARKRTLQLHERTFKFAAAVLLECPRDPIPNIAARELWRQLARAAPSTSNNLLEADEASSTLDFIAKMKIALREAKESRNCLRFLVHCKLAPRWRDLMPLEDEARQLSSIFATILIRVKRRYEDEKEARRKPRKSKN